jgi:hypothetical protein
MSGQRHTLKKELTMTEITSTAPAGEQFTLPTKQDESAEILRLQGLVAEHRAQAVRSSL